MLGDVDYTRVAFLLILHSQEHDIAETGYGTSLEMNSLRISNGVSDFASAANFCVAMLGSVT